MSTVDQEIKTIVDELLKAISTKNIIAEPIEVGDDVVITITKVGLGFGVGMGEAKGERGGGSGGGAGGAAGITPVAAVVIHKSISGPGGIEVRTLAPPSAIGKAVGDVASALVERMSTQRAKKKEEGEKETHQP